METVYHDIAQQSSPVRNCRVWNLCVSLGSRERGLRFLVLSEISWNLGNTRLLSSRLGRLGWCLSESDDRLFRPLPGPGDYTKDPVVGQMALFRQYPPGFRVAD